jgi:hypothetical protein
MSNESAINSLDDVRNGLIRFFANQRCIITYGLGLGIKPYGSIGGDTIGIGIFGGQISVLSVFFEYLKVPILGTFFEYLSA